MAAATDGPRTVAVVLGTRPEAIKLAGIVAGLDRDAWVLHTGQHYDVELGRGPLADLGFPAPHEMLEVGGSSRGQQIGEATSRLDALFGVRRPQAVVVQGDTNATVAGALAANAAGVPLVHVEAGLRSHDRLMPEEHNRVVTDHLSDLCCAPTTTSEANLAAEGITGERVVVTGNPVVEAVMRLVPHPGDRARVLARYGCQRGAFVMATLHRPENVDEAGPLELILRELGSLPLPTVLPLHPRTKARVEAFGLSRLLDGIDVVAPLPPRMFLALAAEAAVWVSDSGGLQEEASVLKRPVVVVRRSTERPEVLGTFAVLVSPGPEIGAQVRAWHDDLTAVHGRLADEPSPYGDGSASTRIVAAIEHLMG